MLLLFAGLFWFHERLRWRLYRLVPLFNIGIHYIQLLSSLAVLAVWPDSIREMFEWFSLFNLNIDFISVECVGLGYSNKWLMIQLLPFFLAASMISFRLVQMAFRAVCARPKKGGNDDNDGEGKDGDFRSENSRTMTKRMDSTTEIEVESIGDDDFDSMLKLGGGGRGNSLQFDKAGGGGSSDPNSSALVLAGSRMHMGFDEDEKVNMPTQPEGGRGGGDASSNEAREKAGYSWFTHTMMPIMNPLLISLICLYQLLCLRVFQVGDGLHPSLHC
jgi:hypothetical protein